MPKKILAYPEREIALVLSAAKSPAVYDAAVSAGLLAEHITQPAVAAIWTGIAAQRDGGEETVRSAPLREHLRAANMEAAAKPIVNQIRDFPVSNERQAVDDAQRIVAAARARASDTALSAALVELREADDAQAALAMLKDRAFGIAVDQDRARAKRTLHDVLSGLVAKIADPVQRARRIVGIPTHIAPLDAKTRGDQLGKVTIIGARPGAGKTAFVTSTLADAIERNDPTIHPMDPTLFFSLEMDDEELVARVMCAMAGIDYESMMYGPKPDAVISRRLIWAADCINASPLEIDDETPRTVEQIAAEIYRWHRRVFSRRKTRGKVVIDYLTRIKRSPGIKNLQDHVMHCMAVLADVAKRTGLAIVVLSQLTRGHVKEGRMPEMDDLKGGGDVEENAFHVILLHPLGKTEDAAAGRPWRGSVAAMVEKNRAGPTGMVMLKFDGAMYRFRAWSNEHDGSLEDVLGSMSTARPGAPKKPYKPTQKSLPIPPSRPAPGDD
jgi:replicative DNA helicase